jgi:hypothetical protein
VLLAAVSHGALVHAADKTPPALPANPKQSAGAFHFSDPVVDAADQGNVSAVKSLIAAGKPVDGRGRFDATPLMRAAFQGNTDIVKYLISVGANVNARDVGGATALHMAARRGHDSVVKQLLDARANPDQPDHEGWTPLMRATLQGHKKAAEMLIESGANVDATNTQRETALMMAAFTGNADLTKLLINHGAQRDIADSNGLTAAEIAFQRGYTGVQEALADQSVHGRLANEAPVAVADSGISKPRPDSGTNARGVGAMASDGGSIRAKLDDKDAGTNAVGVGASSLQKDIQPVFDNDFQPKKPDAAALPIDLDDPAASRKPWAEITTPAAPMPADEPAQTPLSDSGLFDKEEPALSKESSSIPPLNTARMTDSMPARLEAGPPADSAPINMASDGTPPTVSFTRPATIKPEMSEAGLAPLPEVSQPPAPGKLQYLVQLGTSESATEAARRWNKLRSEHTDLLGTLMPVMSEVTLRADQREVFRTQAGYFDKKADAASLCNKLNARDVNCYVVEVSATASEKTARATQASSAQASTARDSDPVVEALKNPHLAEAAPAPEKPAAPSSAPVDKAALDTIFDQDPQKDKAKALHASAEEIEANKPTVTRMFPEAKPAPLPLEGKPVSVAELPSTARATPLPSSLEAVDAPKPAVLRALNEDGNNMAKTEAKVVAIPHEKKPLPMSEWKGVEEPESKPAPRTEAPPMELAALPPTSTFSSDVGPADADPYSTAAPLTTDGKPKDGFTVEEAVRVPLAEESPAESMAPVDPIPASQLPSRSSHQNTQWLSIGPFENAKSARKFWDQASKDDASITSGLRFRTTEPFSQRGGKVTAWAEIGPVGEQEHADKLCAYAVDHNMECRVREDLGLSMTANKRGDATPRATQAKAGKTGGLHPVVLLPAANDKEPPAYWVQLGSHASQQEAEQHWGSLMSRAGDVLGSYTAYAMPPRYSSSSETVLRLRLGPFYEQKDALELCGQLRYRNIRCLSLFGS